MKAIEYIKNTTIGDYGLVFIENTNPFIDPSGRKRRAILVKCVCSKVFKVRISDVTSGASRTCGCNKGSEMISYKEGEFINNIKFIKSLGTKTKINAQYALFECPRCLNHWESSIANIKNSNTKSCCDKNAGCWNRTKWTSRYNKASLYKILLYNENESFIKIGITSNKNIKRRFYTIPYKYKILKIIEGDAGYIFDLENRILKKYKLKKYIPLINFAGMTECFTKN